MSFTVDLPDIGLLQNAYNQDLQKRKNNDNYGIHELLGQGQAALTLLTTELE